MNCMDLKFDQLTPPKAKMSPKKNQPFQKGKADHLPIIIFGKFLILVFREVTIIVVVCTPPSTRMS